MTSRKTRLSLLRSPAQGLIACVLVLCAGCATPPGPADEAEPLYVPEEASTPADLQPVAAAEDAEEPAEKMDIEIEGEVAPAVAATEQHGDPRSLDELAEVIIKARDRHEVIHNLVSEAQALLRDVALDYVFTGKGKKEQLRGRPVAFALWSESKSEWLVAQVEIPRPPINWKPGGKPLPFTMLTPGITARHVKGTGAERLMFTFSRDGEPLKVYGRKFPVFDSALLKKKKWRAVVDSATTIVYLPFTEDTSDPSFVSGGKEFLLATAQQAIDELRLANAPSFAFPGQLLADVVPAEVITTLAVIEQTDDSDFVAKKEDAFNDVLNQYGLKRGEAYRYSVSSASAIGPMQFTDRKGNGTYSLVVRRCREAKLDPDFERGATNLLNAMKAAICLFDIELGQMRADIRNAYRDNKKVLGIFPVAAYNGGPRNVTKLYNVLKKMKVKLEELRPAGEQPPDAKPVACPCLWKAVESGIQPVAIPKYNNENRWYIEKYQSILGTFDAGDEPGLGSG